MILLIALIMLIGYDYFVECIHD